MVKDRGWLAEGIPVLAITGEAEGPSLAVLAGVHGDEYEGVRAIYEFFEEFSEPFPSGRVVLVPVANPAAHRAVSRTHPADGKNLARVFPGSPNGTASERLADVLTREVIANSDFLLDLHSGGVKYAMPSMAGFWAADPRGREAALAFGAPVTWGHPNIESGRTISVAKEFGIPFLYVEAWGAGRIRREDLTMMKRGIRNLLIHLDMMAGPLAIPEPPLRLHGAGNTDDGISAGSDGFLLLETELLRFVRHGQRLGRLVDAQGNTIETYTAPRAGIVALTHELPVVTKGDTLFLLADLEP